ncbi:MAG: class I SAM-dependent methyltransferase [Acidimicrobiales bacterium]
MGTIPDPGSFRDPLSRVYVDDTAVWRGLSDAGLADFEAYAATGAFRAAQADGRVVATSALPVDDAPVGAGWAGALRHDRVPVITYPYEWTFSMLKDAALLQIELSREALAEGILTKDATSYNVQFQGSRPVFIDVGSFERLVPGEPWVGYRQFCELFLNPLYLQAEADIPFQPWLRGSVHGISPTMAARAVGHRGRLRRDLFTHVRLHARAEARYADADTSRDVKGELQRAGFGPKLIDAQLANLGKAVARLEWKASASTWSSYSQRGHYSDADLDAKEAFVAAATAALTEPVVLDLGANDGRFSRVAVEAGATLAVAVDGDPLVVDHLYRPLRSEGETRILPLVMDLSDPSPSLGWRGRERPSFVERVRPHLVLCLAVIHHLAISGTVPFPEIVALLRDFDAPLVVEMPHRDDPMTARLLARKREGLFDHYHRSTWEAALRERFEVDQQVTLPSGTRTLYGCRPR